MKPDYNGLKDQKFLNDLFSLNSQIKTLQQIRNGLIDEVVKECEHPVLQIFQYRPIGEPDWLICMKCGLTEEGWTHKDRILKNTYNHPKIDFDTWLNYRTLSIFRDNHKVYNYLETRS